MKLRTILRRTAVLLGLLWVQFVLAGPGLHDPNCPHHRVGATGAGHVDSGTQTPGRHRAHHGAHQGAIHGASHGATHDATLEETGGAGQGPGHGADHPGGPDGSSSDGCRCLGVCIPGPSVGPTTVSQSLAGHHPDPSSVRGEDEAATDRVLPSLALPLLPPSTGPPATA